ncbi:MAG: NYN domain-containing protein [Candidatus Omnitrophota bacterium]|nr:NYN domain-containing protein [Candidatus Omnitrophota bacterium]
MVKERAIVFIDGNNLYNGLKECYGIERLDLEPFCNYLVQGRELVAIYYADANFIRTEGSNNYDKQQAYFSHIRKTKNLIFRKGYFNKRTRPPTEKLADVYLATDLVDLCHKDQFDFAYLISGDSDLTPAVDIVVRQGKKVINVYFDNPKRTSYALRSHCQNLFKNITKTIADQYVWVPPAPKPPTTPIK